MSNTFVILILDLLMYYKVDGTRSITNVSKWGYYVSFTYFYILRTGEPITGFQNIFTLMVKSLRTPFIAMYKMVPLSVTC